MSKKREEILKRTKITVVPAREDMQPSAKHTSVNKDAIVLLDSKSLHIYCYMLSKCDYDGKCCPTYDEFYDVLGLNRNTISKYIKKLSSLGLIDVNKEKVGDFYRNVYTLYV